MWGYDPDGGIKHAVVEYVNEETHGFTEDEVEADIERLQRVLAQVYREAVEYLEEQEEETEEG